MATGDLVWSQLVEGQLLAAALTGEKVAVQTAGWGQLRGSTLSVYSLPGTSSGEAPGGSSGGEPVWSRQETRRLLTSTEGELALVPFNNGGWYSSDSRLDLVDATTGEGTGGYDDVQVRGSGVPWRLLPPGWVARCTAGCGSQVDPGGQADPADRRAELVELGTGRSIDIGPYRYEPVVSMTGVFVDLGAPFSEGGTLEDPEDHYLDLGDGARSASPPAGAVVPPEGWVPGGGSVLRVTGEQA